ncbi:MAG TPA: Nif3-like dinuclear metal center hexameric protein [Nocardioidaceae bacterium]|nr:Nif3-like dinuclear metal center hexameric protein [Nocardioidaceae bacterium]
MTAVPSLADVTDCLDRLYDPHRAESWDAVGPVCGDPEQPVHKVLFAVDPVHAVVDEAVQWGADLVVTHHPLLLRPVHGIAATTPKGRVLHRLISTGIALQVCHTNADTADPGVSDALAEALGLSDLRPLAPAAADPLDALVVYVPEEGAQALVDALSAAGAGAIGDYDRCAFTAPGTGTFRPQPGAHPTIGAVGDIEQVRETRVEMVLPRRLRAAVVSALRAAHPYEEPAFHLVEMAALSSSRGAGRIGVLAEATTLQGFADRVAAALPATAAGVRAAGDPEQPVRTVALCGGAGDSYLDVARTSGADVYLTSDLRHHPASEFREYGGPALVDVAHWAAEWTWLPHAERRLVDALSGQGATVGTRVSHTRTDPWQIHVAQPVGPTEESLR